jgi:hypothetical protein
MRGVDLRVAPGVVLHVRRLRGEAQSKTAGEPIVFDDKRSFVIRIATADAELTLPDLERLLNGYVFAYPNAPLSRLRLEPRGARLHLRAVLHKGVDLPIDIVASISATTTGEIRLHPEHVEVEHLSTGPLLALAHLKLDKLLSLEGSRGARVVGNDIVLQPDSILPPPAIRGRVRTAVVDGDAVRLGFDDPALVLPDFAADAPPDTSSNYLYFHEGTVRIGKLFMVHADLEIVDQVAADPLDFSLDDYQRQLVAGYVKNTAARGLVVFVPDLHTLETPVHVVAPARDAHSSGGAPRVP